MFYILKLTQDVEQLFPFSKAIPIDVLGMYLVVYTLVRNEMEKIIKDYLF